MRLAAVVIFFVSLVIIPFVLLGEISVDQSWFDQYGSWAWLVAIGLIISDTLLPVPATVVITSMGIIYGPILGGIIGLVGTMLAGTLLYGITWILGPRASVFLMGEADADRAGYFFKKWGWWAVALSRWVPVLPETISALAGLARMPMKSYFSALLCGLVPMCFAFSTIGVITEGNPRLALVISFTIPGAMGVLTHVLFKNRGSDSDEYPSEHAQDDQDNDDRSDR